MMGQGQQTFDPAVELVPNRLYALGGMVPLDGRVSWVPASARGYQPVNCYLRVQGKQALLIDSGLACHREQIVDQLAHILPKDCELSLYFTRAEHDVVGNSGAVAARFDVKNVYTGGTYNPFDGFDQIMSPSGEDRSAIKDRVVQRMRNGRVPIGGDAFLDIVIPPFRVLASFWAYDEGTETLFTSCLFGQHHWPDARYRPLALPSDDTSTVESVEQFTTARYWWLKLIQTDGLLTRLNALFDKYPISRIAPSHGSVVQDPALVRRHVDFMRHVLTRPVTQKIAARV